MSIPRHQPVLNARATRRDVALVALVSTAAVLLILWRLDLNTVGTVAFADPGWDRHVYREMARRDLFDVRLAPYCWRILVPLLARLSPGPLQWGFFSVTFAALVATGPAIFLLVRAAGSSRASALTLVFLFYSLGWAARYSLNDFWVPDATAMLFTCVAMWLVISKHWYLAALTLAVGALAKESVVFVAPLAFTWHARNFRDLPALRRALLVAAPALVVIVALRLFVTPENGNAEYIATMPPEISRFPELFGDYDYVTRFREILIDDRWTHRQWSDFDRYVLDPFGVPLLVLSIAGAISDPKRALRLLPFLVLVYSQLLFAADTQRLLVLALPALAVLAGGGAELLSRRKPIPDWTFVSVSALLFLTSLFEPNNFGAPLLRETLMVTTLLAAFVVASRLVGREPRSGEPDP